MYTIYIKIINHIKNESYLKMVKKDFESLSQAKNYVDNQKWLSKYKVVIK